MNVIKEIFGDSVELPKKVLVKVLPEGLRQLVWLRLKRRRGAHFAVISFSDALFTKINAVNSYFRNWSLGQSGFSDGTPCLQLELGVKRDGIACKYMGVRGDHGKWTAVIGVKYKMVYLGRYLSPEEAARVYDSACYYLKGDRALLNFPGEQPQPLADELKAKIDAATAAAQPQSGWKRARDEEEMEEMEEGYEGYEGYEPWEREEEEERIQPMEESFGNEHRIGVSKDAINEAFGEQVELPMKVIFEVTGEGESSRQVAWLRSHSASRASLCFDEPLLANIKNYHGKHRKWSQGVSGPNEPPLLLLELDVKKNGVYTQYMGYQ